MERPTRNKKQKLLVPSRECGKHSFTDDSNLKCFHPTTLSITFSTGAVHSIGLRKKNEMGEEKEKYAHQKSICISIKKRFPSIPFFKYLSLELVLTAFYMATTNNCLGRTDRPVTFLSRPNENHTLQEPVLLSSRVRLLAVRKIARAWETKMLRPLH